MPLDRIITDPIISTENVSFSPHTPTHHHPPSELVLPSERDPLVGETKRKKPFYRARPLWLVPFALTAAITRGMTLASRVQVFTELSCRELHSDRIHSSVPYIRGPRASVHTRLDANPSFTPLYLPSIPPLAHSLEESEGDGISEGDDPRVVPGRWCVSDPAVQARAVSLQTIMTTTMGVLSALTTGWWGQFGERRGRTRVLAISSLGLFLMDLIFIQVSTPLSPLAAHSHKLLILAPIIEGLLGGWSSLTSACTAYIADCTSPGSRATIFARFGGVLCVGIAVGPTIGAWLISNPIPFLKVGQADHPLQSVNSVFWVAILASFVNFMLVIFVIPESLSASQRAMNRKGNNRTLEDDDIGSGNRDSHTWMVTSAIKSFISPLAEFWPADIPVAHSATMPGQPHTRKDWNLTFLALSLFIHTLSSGLFQVKYLYATHIYDWTVEQLSYYMSFTGTVRALHLLVLLPFLLATFKPVRAAVSSAVLVQPNTNGPKRKPKPTKSHLLSEIRFDLFVVRCSMFIELFSHTLVVFSPLPSASVVSVWWSQFLFIGASSLECAGTGISAAAYSLALSTLQARRLADREEIAQLQGGAECIPAEQDAALESGKLFGAIAVLEAVSQAIVGPILFATIYSSTVASFPKAVFAAAAVLVVIAITFTLFVKPNVSLSVLKKARGKTKSSATIWHRAEESRGRSTTNKDLRGGSASSSYYGATGYDAGRADAGTSGHA